MAAYIEVFASGSAMISLPAKSRLGRKDVVGSGFVVKPNRSLHLDKEYLFGNDSLINALVLEQNRGHIQVREDGQLLSASDLNAYSSGGLAAAYNFLRNYVQSGLVFAVGTTPSVSASSVISGRLSASAANTGSRRKAFGRVSCARASSIPATIR